ncbi:hypothetical protein IGI04_037515 [Brassica rapa subsp. trilocularis]|uniref:Uncharacterized protein n=1 Tax=Brassica rapa subsp. trilocularis TaxID=1813537 RepID=A0ABQ7LJA0_BRACM|nr:hypothetical protein IGI04_037515 [Brassica rapa subsp. trilocularis]
MTSYGGEPKFVLITSINPKVVGDFLYTGRLFLNGTSGTHIYFDSETDAGKERHTQLFGDGSNQTSSSSKLIHAQKLEALTISELNQYVLSADPQTEKGWCYIGCASCAKKLVKEETCWDMSAVHEKTTTTSS